MSHGSAFAVSWCSLLSTVEQTASTILHWQTHNAYLALFRNAYNIIGAVPVSARLVHSFTWVFSCVSLESIELDT